MTVPKIEDAIAKVGGFYIAIHSFTATIINILFSVNINVKLITALNEYSATIKSSSDNEKNIT